MLEARQAGFTKATVSTWRVALEARGLGPTVSHRANSLLDRRDERFTQVLNPTDLNTVAVV